MDQILERFAGLNKFLKGLGLPVSGGAPVKKAKIKGQADSPEAKAKQIVQQILKSVKVKAGSPTRRRSASGTMLRYRIKIKGKSYLLKSYVITDTWHMSLVLWDSSEQKMLDVITIGYLRDQYRLRAIGKERMARWAEG